ncbi:hypothetical protein DENSPDRAFT_697918 [Dentipellis sp. KUC8613]|nr:hypothetical protein DENSPDRAFT_697918 [Dentipellis sp. KUC8613]
MNFWVCRYHFWLGSSATGAPASSTTSHEVIINVGNVGGAKPSGSLVANGWSFFGNFWDVYKGAGSNWDTFTFTPSDGKAFSGSVGDMYGFFTYLTNEHDISRTSCIQAAQGGVEVFVGSGSLSSVFFLNMYEESVPSLECRHNAPPSQRLSCPSNAQSCIARASNV